MSDEHSGKTVGVAVIGAGGRMGREVIRAVAAEDRARVAAAVERSGHETFGTDAHVLVGLPACDVLVSDDLTAALAASDVAVDFSSPSTTASLAESAAGAGCPMVTGVTGLSDQQREALKQAASKVPVVAAPNMSVGVNLLRKLVAQTTSVLGTNYDVEVVEYHHRHKVDAPSGTALMLAEAAASARKTSLDQVGRFSRAGQVGPRDDDEIGVLAVRAGEIVGEHVVLFAGPGERVELTHRALSRANFALGAVRAALWVIGRPPGLYDMQDVLGLK
jgi:4-hydroxy-tetrahydrodipicolinate reductase